ncbi:MAG: phage portal protein [Bacillota bacterium]|nr:phage portal protein [Bacillota bacterium]
MFGKILEKRSSINIDGFDFGSWLSGKDVLGAELNENSYFTALNKLSDSVAKLPIMVKQFTEKGEIEAKKHYLWDILSLKPNSEMNAFTAIKSLIMMYKHFGMAGLYINRDYNGNVQSLVPVRIDQVLADNVGLFNSNLKNKVLIYFTCINAMGSCFDKDIIILRDNSIDGIYFKPTRQYLKNAIDTSMSAQDYQKDLFSNGLTNKAVVQLTSDIKDEKDLKKIQDKFNRLYSNNGRIFTVPAGFNITPMNLSLADSQFIDLKKFSKQDIANAIGVPYALLENGTLSEQETISYLDNTISPILIQLEQEFDYKLLESDMKQGYKIRFNVNSMLRTSPLIQKNIIIDYVKNGIYSLEYARNILGVDYEFENETITLPSGQILLKDLLNGQATWQKSNNTTTDGGGENG